MGKARYYKDVVATAAVVLVFELVFLLLYYFIDIDSFLVVHKLLPLILAVPLLVLVAVCLARMRKKVWVWVVLAPALVLGALICVPVGALAATEIHIGGLCLDAVPNSDTALEVKRTTCSQPTSVYVQRNAGPFTRRWLVARCTSADTNNSVGPQLNPTWTGRSAFVLKNHRGELVDEVTVDPTTGRPDHVLLEGDRCPRGGSG
ncbi:hypothetical protein [Nocardia sp. NPDC051832]|uniref:hypothetical protein n=1 Tax=Nocardia sp. NPDC051832 TaxID=3155673 RepID=UPI003421BAC9